MWREGCEGRGVRGGGDRKRQARRVKREARREGREASGGGGRCRCGKVRGVECAVGRVESSARARRELGESSHQRWPKRATPSSMSRSSSTDQRPLLTTGSRWLYHRSRHCLPQRPWPTCCATTDHRPTPRRPTTSMSRLSCRACAAGIGMTARGGEGRARRGELCAWLRAGCAYLLLYPRPLGDGPFCGPLAPPDTRSGIRGL